VTDKYYNITHNDLDGVSCLLTQKWLDPSSTFFYKTVTNISVVPELEFLIKNSINPKNIIVTDLALRKEFLDFDHSFVKFIDHHQRSEKWIKYFKNSEIICKNFSSNTRLLYEIFKDQAEPNLTKEQKQFILYVDDYDSGVQKFSESHNLNLLYWTKYKNEPNLFIKDFQNGYREFSKSEKNLIKNVKLEFSRKAESFQIFKGVLEIENKSLEVVSTFGEGINSGTLDILSRKYDSDLFFFINIKTKKVILRQKYSQNLIDLSAFAEKYLNGSGNNLSAGGILTELFLEITKNFKPI
jgi:hypothetical protein